MTFSNPFTPEHFARHDEGEDAAFYACPRLVTHIDDPAIAALTGFYRRVLPAGGDLLDLMSSWISHYPEDVAYRTVVGHGMNAEELSANPRFDRWHVQDLNQEPRLPYADASFDAVTIAVSVQYLARPVDVFREIARVLKPGGGVVVSYSNRMFPTKAVAIWQALPMAGQAELIAAYCKASGGFDAARAHDLSPAPGQSDPLVAVVAVCSEGRDQQHEGEEHAPGRPGEA